MREKANTRKNILNMYLCNFIILNWCERWDLNPQGCYHPQDFKSCLFTNFSTLASPTNRVLQTTFKLMNMIEFKIILSVLP